MHAKSFGTGSIRKSSFRTQRAYRRHLKRVRDKLAMRQPVMDTAKALETLEQRVLLSASPTFQLSSLLAGNGGDGSHGVVINGVSLDDRAGISVNSAGDVNGDGYEDVIIGAFRDAPNGVDSGSAYVVFGQAGGFNASLQLSALNGTNGFKLNGVAAGDFAGRSVAGVGDVNGDGYDDMLVGAFGASTANGATSGQAYVVYGHAGSFASTINLSALNGTDGFTIDGLSAGDQLGFSVRAAGDVNGDGLSDFILGAATSNPNGAASGTAYLVFGQTGTASSLDLSTLNGSNGVAIEGVSADDQLGISVSGAGDVNGDGLDDLVVGVYQDSTNGANAGAAYVVFGTSGFGSGVFDPASLNGSNGFAVYGQSADDNAGRSVASAGDFNGDGYDDVLIGAPLANGSSFESGAAYIVFGHSGSFAGQVNLAALNGTDGFKLNGIDNGDSAGFSVGAAGDVNGDGLGDVLVSAHLANPNGTRSGETYLVLGRTSAMPASINLSGLSGADGFVLKGINAQDRSGISARGAGDVDGDGYDDIIIGAFLADPNGDASGESYLVFGGDFSDAVTLEGTSISQSLTGTAGDDDIVAGGGDDIVTSNGGADVLIGGEGDDEFVIIDTNFKLIDGGTGTNALTLTGNGTTLDLTTFDDARLRDINAINLSGASNTLTLDLNEVLSLTDSTNTLTVTANISGTVNIGSGWTLDHSDTVNSNPRDTYTQGNATLVVITLQDVVDPVVTIDPLTTASGSPELTGTVTDDDPATAITVTVDGNDYSATNNGDGTWTLAAGTISPDLTDGVYDVQITGEDSSGNVGVDNTSDELTVDLTGPMVTIDTLYTSDASPQLTGTVSDTHGVAGIEVTVDGNAYTATDNGDGTWTLDAGTISPDLTEGVYDVSVSATDALGNVGADASTDELTVDQTAPVLTIDDPGTTTDSSPQITGTIDDVDPTAMVEVDVNGSFYEAVNNGDGTWTLPAGTITPALTQGSYAVQARGTDTAGNVGVTNTPATLTINQAPVLTIDPLTTSDQTPQITGTIVDDNTTADITVTVNGIEYTATNNGDGTWTLADDTITPALADGTYDITASVTDDSGNTGVDSTTDELVIDTTTPVVTVDTLISNVASPELTGTVTGYDVTIEVTVDGNSYTPTLNGDGTWTLAAGTISPDLTDGVYDVAVTATNAAQTPGVGTDATTDELTIDTTQPVVTFIKRLTSDSTPTLTGSVTDNDPDTAVQVTINGVGTYDALNNGDGTWTLYGYMIATPIPRGIYDITVTAEDSAGNAGVKVQTSGMNIQPAAFTVNVDPLTTGDTTPQLTGTIDDPAAAIKVTVNGTTYNTAVNNGDGTWTLADDTIGPALADGSYLVIVTGTIDWNTVGTEVEGGLVIDTSPPVVTVDQTITSDSTPQLTGTIDDTTATINVTVNGYTFTATNNGDGTWTLANNTITPALTGGTYDVSVEATDELGNVGTDASVDELQITAPIISSLDLNDLFAVNGGDGSEGTVFQGVTQDDLAGNSAASLGDINGDGFDDIIIGAPGADPIGDSDGVAYVIFGSASGFSAEFDLSTLDGTNGFRIDALGLRDDLGVSVSTAGDLNGDGLDDIVIGADKADPGVFNEGAAYVIYGSTSSFGATFDLSTLDGTNGFVFNGEANSDRAGFSVNTAGDVNGDGLDDLVVGSLNGDDGVTADTGRAYVIFGSTAAMPAALTAASLDGTVGFIVTGETTGDQTGFSVGSAGDVNGDGISDLLIGAPGVNSDTGAVYVIFGTTAGFSAEINVASLDGTNGFAVEGDAVDMQLGFSVSTIGDLNGDGLADLLIGAPASNSSASTGGAYVIYGSDAAFSATIPVASLDGTNGFVILGNNNSATGAEYTGFNVSGVGDVNGDGLDDMLIGAPYGNKSGAYENGQSYLVFGRSIGFGATLDLANVPGDTGLVINGRGFQDHAGRYVHAAGDVNGDGYDDLLVAARDADANGVNNAGETYLIYGRDFTGTSTDIGGAGTETFTGTASRDAIVAGAGDDELIGNGGPDVLSAGQGDDLLAVSDTGFVRLTGGTGFDTLRLDGSGLTLDLTAIPDSAVTGIERIDIRGSGANTLTLNAQEVLNLSDSSNTLLVLSDSDDTVNIGAGWTAAGQEMIDGMTFDVYTQGNATLKLMTISTDTTAPVVTVDALTTDDTTPQLTGTVVDDDPGTTVQVTVNGTAYDATNNGDGTWTLADNAITMALAVGTYDVSVTATDTSNNVGTDATTDELVIQPVAIPGDLNGDGYVGLDDLQPILDHWNQNVTIGDASMGDISGPGGVPDGYIGLDDLQPVLDHWNEGVLPAAETSAASTSASASESTAQDTTQVQTVSVVEEAASAEPATATSSKATTSSSDDAGWGWMLQADNPSSRSAFDSSADNEASDSVLDLVSPMDSGLA